MQAKDRAELLSLRLQNLMDLAGNANDAITKDMRKTARKILESEFHDMESGINDGLYKVIIDNVLPLAALSENLAIKKIGHDAQENLQKRNDELDMIKKRLDKSLEKIDSLTSEQIVLTLEQLQYGLDASLQYILTGKRIIQRKRLKVR